MDLVLEEIRRAETSEAKEATTRYYDEASQEAIDEENSLAAVFSATSGEIKVDD